MGLNGWGWCEEPGRAEQDVRLRVSGRVANPGMEACDETHRSFRCILLGSMRQEIRAHAEAWLEVEDADQGSCGTPVRLRRRAKQELRSGKPFDDAHSAA